MNIKPSSNPTQPNPGIYKAPISSCQIKDADEIEKYCMLFMIYLGKTQGDTSYMQCGIDIS